MILFLLIHFLIISFINHHTTKDNC